jgi:hypothetical protein
VGVEGAEDGAFCSVGWLGVVDCVDEEREAKDVREKNKLLWVVSCGFFPVLAVIDWNVIELTCRTSLLICPTLTRKSNAAIHSLVLRRTSLAKSWRCVTSRDITYLRRSSGPWELITMVFSVILSILRSFMGGILTFEGSMIVGF